MAVYENHLSLDMEKLKNRKAEMDAVRLEAALGHKQELVRNFGLWSLTSLGIVIAKYDLRPLSRLRPFHLEALNGLTSLVHGLQPEEQ